MRHEIRGRVIDSFTGDGIGGVRVEAWDKDFLVDDFLNWAVTRSDGSFKIIFDESAFQDLFDKTPDLFFKVYCYNEQLVSTENSVVWNVAATQTGVEIKAPHPRPHAPTERHIYLKIERLEGYCPVMPQDKVVPPVQYGRDCM